MDDINKQLEITPLSLLKDYASGDLVELPPFAEGKPFVARLKRPSMMVLMKTGKIPNSLLLAANALFVGDYSDAKIDENFYTEALQVIEILAEASFVQPSWNELKEAGVELTDDQYMFIFNYTQNGVKALEPFREERKSLANNTIKPVV